jgi:hypothetical protein
MIVTCPSPWPGRDHVRLIAGKGSTASRPIM